MTHQFTVGQLVYINDKRSMWHGYPRTVEKITRKEYPYLLDDGFYYADDMLSAESPTKAQRPAQEWQTMDIDSGMGIGGINNDQAAPFVPSAAATERVQRRHDTDTVCRRCGASKNFDGAMFTNLGGSSICDDCA